CEFTRSGTYDIRSENVSHKLTTRITAIERYDDISKLFAGLDAVARGDWYCVRYTSRFHAANRAQNSPVTIKVTGLF
ncbi:MAG: hypothetical protein RSB55_07365, partial [Oscillospiraceae bacterium]